MTGNRRWGMRSLIGFCLALSPTILVANQSTAKPWTLEPRLTVSERYDDNILSVENNPESDSVTTISPGLALTYKEEQITLDAEYDALIERFSRHSDLDNVGHYGSVDFLDNQLFGSKKTTFFFKDVFQYTPQLQGALTAPGLPPAGAGVGLPRNNTWLNTAVLALSRLSTARLTERIQYINSLVRFEDPTLIDSTTHEGDLAAIYQLDPNNELSGEYRFRYFDFVQSGVADGRDHALLVGFTHRFSPTFSITMNLGPSYSIQSGSYVTPVGMVRLSKIFEKLTINAEYSRDISAIAGVSSQLVVTQTVSSDLTYTMTKKFNALLGAGLTNSDAFTGEELKIVYWNVRTGLTYQILKWLFVEIRYNHFGQQATGNSAGNDFNQNQYIFGLTGKYPWNFGGRIE